MTPERWRQVTEAFHAALARDTPARGAVLDEMCAGDAALRAEVDALLAAHHDAGRFGDTAPTEPAAAARLRPGDALGPYRIESLIGAGGMGEVYKARDTRLDRDVAVKVLPAPIAGDARFRQRMEREARALATLSHPHICPVFDFGQQDGIDYLVMEYLAGETLARRLERGPLPLAEALRRAVEIADALDKAHRQGIVHRDLKPGNVMLTKGGAKLLDFGIAKMRPPAGATGARHSADDPLTRQGTVLGTLHYMAPEQLSGEEADARADIFAFGAVLYEMVTGKKAFDGRSRAEVMAAVMGQDPASVATLQPAAPPALDHLIRASLARDPDQRWQSASDVGRQIKWILGEGSTTGAHASRMPAFSRVRSAGPLWAVGLMVVAAVTVAVMTLTSRRRAGGVSHPPVEFVVRLDQALDDEMVLTKDGRTLVMEEFRHRLLVRGMAASSVRAVEGATGWLDLVDVSPDGQWVAYVDYTKKDLRRVPLDGGTPVTIARGVEMVFGGSWGPANTLVYSLESSGLWMVAVDGGPPRQLTTPDHAAGERGHWYPQFLPGGDRILFGSVRTPVDSASIQVLDLTTGRRTLVAKGGMHGMYVPTGHVVYVRGEALWAVPFDLAQLRVTGPAVPVLEDVGYEPREARGAFTLSEAGTLAYMKGSVWNVDGTLVWVDRDGRERAAASERGVYAAPRVARDGRRLALEKTLRGETDIWIYDLEGGRNTRVTRDATARYPAWTQDGLEVIYGSSWPPFNLFRGDAAASTPGRVLAAIGFLTYGQSTSPGGRELAYTQRGPAGHGLMLLSLDGPPAPRIFRDTESDELSPAFSPDGRWIAYESNEAGAFEIWIDPYPDGAGGRTRRRISSGGGVGARWGPHGELFYRRGDRMMAVPIDLGSGAPGRPVELFADVYKPGGAEYDVSPDGRRFLMIKPRPDVEARREVTVVLNWTETLKQRAPTAE